MNTHQTDRRALGRAALLLALACLPLGAQEAEELPDIEITIQRYRQPKADAAAPVVVLDRAAIVASGGLSVRDVLAGVPGIEVRPQGAAGAQTGVSLRGSKTEQVLVLVDGRRVSHAQGGGVDLSDFPLHDVERIEVLKGGGSALYGSDPVGGVINIVTRRGGSGGVEAGLGVGSFGTWTLDLGTGDQAGRGTWRASWRQLSQVGDFEFKDDAGQRRRRQNGRLLSIDARADGSWDFGRWGELRGGFSLYHAVKGVPGRLAFPSPQARQRDFRYDVHADHRFEPAPGLELSSNLYWLEQVRDYEDPTGAFPVNANHRNYLFAAELLATTEVSGKGRAVAGLDYRRDQVQSSTDGRHHRLTGGVFGLYEIAVGPVTLVPSLRLDGQTGQTPIVSPKLGLVAEPTRSVTVRAATGRSFRAPSFDDLYWPADAFAKGNPNLRPEHATEFELGAEWRPSRGVALGLTYHNRNANDLILWQPGLGGQWSPQNVQRVRFQGFEWTGQAPLPLAGLSARAGYSYLKATTHSGTAAEIGRQLLGHPYHQGDAGLRYERGQWLADLHLVAVDRRYTTAANTQSLPAYATVDATLRWRPGARDELLLQARNLLDTSYRTVVDYPLPGRELRFTASRRF